MARCGEELSIDSIPFSITARLNGHRKNWLCSLARANQAWTHGGQFSIGKAPATAPNIRGRYWIHSQAKLQNAEQE